MKLLISVLSLAMLCCTTAYSNDLGSFCTLDHGGIVLPSNDTVVWRMDGSLLSERAILNMGATESEILRVTEASLQSVQRDSKAKLRHRLYWSTGVSCDPNTITDHACIGFRLKEDDSRCNNGVYPETDECDITLDCPPFSVCSLNMEGQQNYCTSACHRVNGQSDPCSGNRECGQLVFECDAQQGCPNSDEGCFNGICLVPCLTDSECSGSNETCFNGTCHGTCGQEGPNGTGTPQGYAYTVVSGRPSITICTENVGDYATNKRDLFDTIRHEYLHTLAAGHVEDCASCDGEMMCSGNIPEKTMASGDGAGIRKNYGVGNGYTQKYAMRSVFSTSVSDSTFQMTSVPFSGLSSFTPRIDCRRGGGDCVSVRGVMIGVNPHLVVTKLSGVNAYGAWSSAVSWAYIPWSFHGEPDIAISDNGEYAYVVARTRTSGLDRVAAVRVSLNSYAVEMYSSSASLDEYLDLNRANPRIETLPVSGAPFLLTHSGISNSSMGLNMIMLNSDLSMSAASSPMFSGYSSLVDENDETMWGNFDVDCQRSITFINNGRCAIVGTAQGEDSIGNYNRLGSFFSSVIEERSAWTYISGYWVYQFFTWAYIPGHWELVPTLFDSGNVKMASYGDAQSIEGVALIPKPDDQFSLFISAGYLVKGSYENSRIFRFNDADDISSGGSLARFDSDTSGCDTVVTTSGTIYPRTQYGGTDLSWSETQEQLVSFKNAGATYGSGFCY